MNWRWPFGLVCHIRGWMDFNHGHRLLWTPDHPSHDFICMTCGMTLP